MMHTVHLCVVCNTLLSVLSRSVNLFVSSAFPRGQQIERDGVTVMTEVVSGISRLLEGQEAIPYPISVGWAFEKQAY